MPLYNSIPLGDFKYGVSTNLLETSATFNYRTTPSTSIPLGDFNYRGNILSSATFNYDNIIAILKDNAPKLLTQEPHQLNKNDKNKFMYKGHSEIIKINKIKHFYKSSSDIVKCEYKILYNKVRSLSKEDNKCLIIKNDTEIQQKSPNKYVESININTIFYSQNATLSSKGYSSISNIIKDKSLEKHQNNLIINNEKMLKKDNINIYIDKGKALESKIIPLNITNINTKLLTSPEDINLINYFGISLEDLRLNQLQQLIKYDNFMYFDIYNKPTINQIDNKPLELYTNKDMIKSENSISLGTVGISNIDKEITDKYLNTSSSLTLHKNIFNYLLIRDHHKLNISLDDSCNLLCLNNSLNVIKHLNEKLIHRLSTRGVTKELDYHYLKSINIKDIFNIDTYNYLVKESLINSFKNNNNHYLNKEALTNVTKNLNNYLNRVNINDSFKIREHYLNHPPIRPIYDLKEKGLLNITIEPICKELPQLLSKLFTPINKECKQNHYIEITKRWWWLRETDPRDKLIVPNRDYGQMSELMSNVDYEYLRYNNHPIEWGKNWGIDWNIPPYAISIEIMLDLINILIMVWHHDTQAWLNCTGKEGIQFMMELIYDWYSMGSSTSNASYNRVYRWIRWEAEKVYFLNTNNGLQAIGILIANLIDYMRIHHFDITPLWRNPKAMDIERNYNRNAINNDLIIDLDKIKGKRHYFIETQNFEKKDYIRRK